MEDRKEDQGRTKSENAGLIMENQYLKEVENAGTQRMKMCSLKLCQQSTDIWIFNDTTSH